MEASNFVVVLITAPDEKTAAQLANVLMEEQQAACVNMISGVSSIFPWEGKLSNEQEVLLIVKTRGKNFTERFVPLVKEHHPYEVPEIIALPVVNGSQEYLAWMEGEIS